MSSPGHQALLLLLAARLASSRLLSARRHRSLGRPPHQRTMAALPRLHERSAHRALHQLRRNRRRLVRRHVGQARRRLAARPRPTRSFINCSPARSSSPNHHKTPFPGEDYQTFEKDLPGDNTTGWGGATISQLPLETSDTMYRGGSWGFNLRDTDPKSLRDLIQYLVRAAGNNANFLLNVGPMPNGDDSTCLRRSPPRDGSMAEDLRRLHLRNHRWTGEARRMGRHHATRQHHLRSRPRSVADRACACPASRSPSAPRT